MNAFDPDSRVRAVLGPTNTGKTHLAIERLCGHLLDRKNTALTLGVGTVDSAVACFTDYQLTPKRLHPGYEKHLSRPSLAVVYGAFGVGLAIGAMLCRR